MIGVLVAFFGFVLFLNLLILEIRQEERERIFHPLFSLPRWAKGASIEPTEARSLEVLLGLPHREGAETQGLMSSSGAFPPRCISRERDGKWSSSDVN